MRLMLLMLLLLMLLMLLLLSQRQRPSVLQTSTKASTLRWLKSAAAAQSGRLSAAGAPRGQISMHLWGEHRACLASSWLCSAMWLLPAGSLWLRWHVKQVTMVGHPMRGCRQHSLHGQRTPECRQSI